MRIHCLVFGYKRVISFLQSNRLFSPMSPTYAHLCHANRAAFGRKTAYVSASCLVAFLSNLALTKSCVFRVHITQGHGRNRRFSWQKRTQVEDFAPLGVASLGSKRFPTHGRPPHAAARKNPQTPAPPRPPPPPPPPEQARCPLRLTAAAAGRFARRSGPRPCGSGQRPPTWPSRDQPCRLGADDRRTSRSCRPADPAWDTCSWRSRP